MLQRLLELPIPVVGVGNRPATVHSEYLLVAGIHIASECASYGDSRIPRSASRRRGCTSSGKKSRGRRARSGCSGLVSGSTRRPSCNEESSPERVAHERALERVIEIARRLAAEPPLYRALQKQTFNLDLRRRIVEDVPFGMELEGLTATDLAYQHKT